MGYSPGGLTCVGLKGWQHGYKHIVQEERAAVHSDGARQQPAEIADIAVLGGLQFHGRLVLTEFPHGEGCQRLVCPCRDLAIVHIGRDDDSKLAFATLAV